MSLRRFCKTSSEDVWVRRIYSSWSRRLEDALKTSSEDEDERSLQDVFIKTNVCWGVFFSKLLIIFWNVFRSYPFSQNISVRYYISSLKYFSEQILVALARNPLSTLLVVPRDIQEFGLICTFVRADFRWTSNSYLPLLFSIFTSRKFKHVSSSSSSIVSWMCLFCLFKIFWNSRSLKDL